MRGHVSRRSFLWSGVAASGGLAAVGAVETSESSSSVAQAATTNMLAFNVQDYGAKGDGTTDDTAAFQNAFNAAAPGGVAVIPKPSVQYLVSGNIQIPGRLTVLGAGWNTATPTIKLKDGSGASCVFGSRGYLTNTRSTDGPVVIRDLSIDCNGANNAGVHGIVLMNFSSAIERCFARNPALAGFVYSDANSAGVVISNVAVENAIRWCKVQYDAPSPTSGQFGIWVKDTNASGRVTDGYCIGNVVTGAGDAAIRIERAAGWFIEHNHAYLVEQDGMFFSYVWSSYIHHNEVDHFGMAGGAATYWGMRVESVLQNNQPSRNGRPSTFDHNIVSTDESKGGAGTTYRYFRVRNATGTGTGIVHFSHNTAHRDAVGPGTSVAYDFQSNGGVLDIVGGFNVADGPSPVPVTGSGTLNQQAPSRILYAKSQPIAVGVNGSYGSATTFTTESFSLGIVPTALALIWGGSFSAGETANAQVVAGYSDGSTNTVTFGGVTSDGTQSANDAQRFSLYKDGLYLTSLAVSARTTASSTAVTLTTEIAGFNAN